MDVRQEQRARPDVAELGAEPVDRDRWAAVDEHVAAEPGRDLAAAATRLEVDQTG
jgi:hypothetical protein